MTQLPGWCRKIILSVLGIGIGYFLFYFMALMIRPDGDFIGDRRGRPSIEFGMVRDTTDLQTRERTPPEQPEDISELPQPDFEMSSMDASDMPQVDINLSGLNLGGDGAGIGTQDSAPAPLVRVEPQYPRQAAMSGQEGWVRLRFDINASGDVENVEVVDSEPRRVFDSSARQAVLRWKYRPMVRDGKPVVREGIVVQLDFNLSDQ